METRAKISGMLYNNLLILGFNKTSVEKEHRVSCDVNMFCLPNQKMYEIVTHFLFSKLNEVSKQQYKMCWPLFEKDQKRQFQKMTVTYLTEISQMSQVKFPRIVPSVLSTFGGDRFYTLYLAFSTHVVWKTIENNKNVSLLLKPNVTHRNFPCSLGVLRTETNLSQKKFKQIVLFSEKNLILFVKTANKFLMHIQKLKCDILSNQSLFQQKKENVLSLFSSANAAVGKCTLEDTIRKILHYVQKVKKDWQRLTNFLCKEEELWNRLSPILETEKSACVLDGTKLKFAISDIFKDSCSEIRKIGCIEDDEGNVDLLKFLKTFKIFLNFYNKHLAEGDNQEFQKLLSTEKTSCFDENIRNIGEINKTLEASISDISKSVESLQKRLFSASTPDDMKDFIKKCPSWSFCLEDFEEEFTASNHTRIRESSSLLDNSLKTGLLNIFPEDSKVYNSQYNLDSLLEPQTKLVNALSVSVPASETELKGKQRELNRTDLALHSNSTMFDSLIQSDIFSDKTLVTDSNIEASSYSSADLLDLDLDFLPKFKTKNVKFRESWALEETEELLNTMTLPHMSFEED